MLILHETVKFTAMALIAGGLAFSAVETFDPGQAEAASITKKVKIGGKFIGKGFAHVEKMGRAAQKSRGIGKPIGGILKNVGKAGKNGTKKLNKGIGKTERAGTRLLTKSKTGKAVHRLGTKISKAQTKAVNNAFRKCRGKACKFAKGGVKIFLPF